MAPDTSKLKDYHDGGGFINSDNFNYKNNPMLESKKLSELISDLSRFHARAEYTDDMSEYHKTIETIGLIKNQIDQKFEELRYECEKKIKDKWFYYAQVMNDRVFAEYKKYERYMTTKEWIKIAVEKTISTLKKYEANSKKN